MLILIIEDDSNLAMLSREVLENFDYDTIHVTDIAAALHVLKTKSPDIMILDYLLNSGNAGEFLSQVKAEKINIPPFIIITGYGDEKVAVEMMKNGARDYLTKDIHFLELLPQVVRRIGREIENETQLKKAEKELYQIETLQGLVLNSLDESVHFVDRELRIRLINSQCREWLGNFEISNIIGKKLDDVFPFLSDETIKVYQQILVTGIPKNSIDEARIKGKRIITDTRRIPLINEGEITGIITIIKDITKSEMAEEERLKTKLLLEETQQLTKVGGWEYDIKNKKTTWTKETYILHGLDPNKEQNKSNEIIKKSLSCYIGEGRARIEEAFTQCVKNGIPYDMVLPFQKFSGEKIWIRTTAKNLSKKGAKNRIIGNIMDVTDIKEFQEKLDISRKSYEDIFNSVFEAIYIQDVDGTFINVNRTAELLHNIPKEQLIGLNPKDIGVENLNDYKMIDRKMHHTFNTAETSHLEFWALRQGEVYFPEEIMINKGKYFEKDVIIATGRDISERMREEIVRNAQLRLIEYSADHSVKELLTKFLDDTEKITHSSIGFYHFLKENQKDIARSIWSTRTKNTLSQMGVSSSFCHPLKKEGNWFRCISEKKPVIQNDYQKTANNNQMPKDHIRIERELVVPVIRNKKILAVLGLGNKPSNYTENDLKTVQKLADLAWETVERKRIEEKLIKREQRLRTIINAVPSMIFVNNRDGKILSANDAMADILGVKVTEIFGKSHIELFKNSDLARKTSEVTKRVIESGETEEFISELTNYKGEKKWIHSVITPYEGDDFGELAVLGVSADITNLKKAEQSIQKSEEQFRTLVTNLPGIAFRCLNDVNWTMLYFSEKASEITGYKNTDFIKNKVRSYSSIIHPEDGEKVRKKVEKSIETSTIYSIEYRILCADGSIKWVMEKGQGITDKKGKLHYIDGVIMDITQNKKSEKERAKLEEKLRRTQKLETIGTLAGGIAHDFNNILTPIMGYSDMALAKMQPYNPIYDDLQHILKASIRAKELVKQILVFSRQLETEHKPLKLHLIVNEALKLLRPSIPSTIKINLNLDKEASFVDADPAQIHQIIINLCTNSFHAMEGSGGELTIDLAEVEIDRQTASVYENLEEKKYVKLSIKDTGHGMDKMLVERIFEPFFTTKSVEKGTGMGLSVVHGIVRDHNGEITVYSEPGKGTVFHIFFPAVENIEKEEIEKKEEISVGNENILIVDDEEAITKMSKKMLSYIGYKVDIVNNSKVALKMLLDNPSKYHLLITDLTMPELTGIDLAKNLYDNGVKLPIIIMTGYGDQISVEEQNKYNIKKIISKPLIYSDFAKEIRNVFNET